MSSWTIKLPLKKAKKAFTIHKFEFYELMCRSQKGRSTRVWPQWNLTCKSTNWITFQLFCPSWCIQLTQRSRFDIHLINNFDRDERPVYVSLKNIVEKKILNLNIQWSEWSTPWESQIQISGQCLGRFVRIKEPDQFNSAHWDFKVQLKKKLLNFSEDQLVFYINKATLIHTKCTQTSSFIFVLK